ncbi:MAG: hypothetical protein D6B26_05600 [Spirochaetaceae bacterium]|nr:MAG: hypothetical protein D6B26_05600 [Spirochaetaceae bacterium]
MRIAVKSSSIYIIAVVASILAAGGAFMAWQQNQANTELQKAFWSLESDLLQTKGLAAANNSATKAQNTLAAAPDNAGKNAIENALSKWEAFYQDNQGNRAINEQELEAITKVITNAGQMAAKAFAAENLKLLAISFTGSLLLFLLWFFVFLRHIRSLSHRMQLLINDLQTCSEMRKQITLPTRKTDELDYMIQRARAWIHKHQEKLFAVKNLSHEHTAAADTHITAMRKLNASCAALSSHTTGMKVRLNGFDQMLGNTAEAIGVLQLKCNRMRDQGSKQSIQVTETTESIEALSANVREINLLTSARRAQAMQIRQKAAEDESKIRKAGDSIQTIEKEIHSVQTILDTINAISEQTSLLSLNAFVESARGSENNKGFEVVANEIRQLADSTAENTASISDLLRKITNHLREAQFFGNKAQHAFQSSLAVIAEFAESMHEIADRMNRTNDIGESMTGDSQELSKRAQVVTVESLKADSTATKTRQAIIQTRNKDKELLQEFETIDTATNQLTSYATGLQEANRLSQRLTRQLEQCLKETQSQVDGNS